MRSPPRLRAGRLLAGLTLGTLLWACAANPQRPDGALTPTPPADGGTPDAMGVPDTYGPDAPSQPDTPASPDVGPDVASDVAPDAGPPSPYGHVPPPAGALPAALDGATWHTHLVDDILPYWTMDAALGTPAGNYPTFRGMDGSPQAPTERRPRMIARQIYAYAAGYLVTGDTALLDHAHAGVTWLLDHAWDAARGGWHTRLLVDGDPAGDDAKTAQDAAYCALGLAAWYFVTRDPAAEAKLLATRDLLFDPAVYWDEPNQRIRDAVSADLGAEVDHESDGGWELVAQLDPINAFLLLTQPVLSAAQRRSQALADMETLAGTLIDTFWADGVFWGVHNKQGQYGTRHVDFGHTLKAYWMILQVDKRLPDHPFHDFLMANVHSWVELAYDAPNGRWAKRMTGAASVDYGSDWWGYAECDQIAATLNLIDYRYTDWLAQTAGHWVDDYVDRTRPAREVVSSIERQGGWVWPWSDSDTAKCNLWKNGYHSAEHALVFYLLGEHLAGRQPALHFAVQADPDGFVARPYVFDGVEVGRQTLGEVVVGGSTLQRVKVTFDQLY